MSLICLNSSFDFHFVDLWGTSGAGAVLGTAGGAFPRAALDAVLIGTCGSSIAGCSRPPAKLDR
jgi:hypothetical protein